ncbi:hypothetical protein PspLS_09757 [Pyricularia sp. CBS 133598]|nr:hypothetical protein PspLS_09757 [Pyricularia sp. CBS 133598]
MVRSKPLPSEVLDYPYTGSGTVEDPYVCEFVPDDPESPLKWMISLRWTIAMAAAGSVFVVSVCSSTYTCAEAGLAAEFGVSKSVATRGISLFLVGYIVGLMIWGLMSEVYGHRNLTVATLALLGAFNLGASESHTLPDLLTCRFLGSIFGSSPMTIASGTVVELFTAEERGVPIAIFAAGPPSWAPWWVLLLVDLRASPGTVSIGEAVILSTLPPVISYALGKLLAPAILALLNTSPVTALLTWMVDQYETKDKTNVIGPEVPDGFRTPWSDKETTEVADVGLYRLCSSCQQLDLGLLGMRADGGFVRSDSVKVLLGHGLGGVRSGRQSCDFCSLIWRSLFHRNKLANEWEYPDDTVITLELSSFSSPWGKLDNNVGHRVQAEEYKQSYVVNKITTRLQPIGDSSSFENFAAPLGQILIYTRPEKLEAFDVERWWSQLILRYADTKLSFDEDRLPAIASIAKEMAQAHELTYVAGLYAEMLPQCLVWAAAATGCHRDINPSYLGYFDHPEIDGDTEPLRRPNVNPSQRASSWTWAHWEGPIANMQLNQFAKFVGHMGGIKVIKQGDEHSHHQSSLVLWSHIYSVTRLQREMEQSEFVTVGTHQYLEILDHSRGRYYWPRHSVCYEITQCDPKSSGSARNDGFVVFDDPLNAAPMEFDLVPVGSLYKWCTGSSVFDEKSGFYRFDIALAVEPVQEDEGLQEQSANRIYVQRGEENSTLLPERYRRLGLAVRVAWRVPDDSGWEAIKAGLIMSFASLSPAVDWVMAWFPFGFFKRFHSYKQICLI